jgi:feruloyl esterase
MEAIASDTIKVADVAAQPPADGVPEHCRVRAAFVRHPESRVEFEVWVPSAWNGKLVVTGNGGYSNALSVRDMRRAISQGYAVAGGDTGHQTSTPDDLLWGVKNIDRIADWGTRSIHLITAPSKHIVARLTGAAPRRAYFYGCSTGGHQGYAEMQQYPQDFDGVIAGAPGNNRVRLNAAFLWQFLANRKRGESATILPASKLPVITKAVIDACDAADGVTDGVVDDPRACRFDPAVLQCPSVDGPNCLTSPQLDALNRLYSGARNPRTGAQIYPGWPKGSEAVSVQPSGAPGPGWQMYWGTTEPARANFWRYWVFDDPKWDWWSFDFDSHLVLADKKVGGYIDHVSPDLSAFKAHGGKAIVYQGWQDPVVNALDTIDYYEKVRARHGSQQDVDGFLRLFLVPGMGHCGGGAGATNFGNQGSPAPTVDANNDLLSALDAWVEKGIAPERLFASRVVEGKVERTRLLCAYPKKAVYAGPGSTDSAASFVCR